MHWLRRAWSVSSIPHRAGCNPQLEGESTGKRSGQQNGVLADEGPIRGKEYLG